MAIIGYARVSTLDQNLHLQTDALNAAGAERIFEDQASGSLKVRPGLDAALDYLRPGDTLVVWKLDRLGRSTKHLLELGERLQSRDVDLVITTLGIDTRTPMGKMVYTMLAAIAEFERDLIRERTKAGLESARARGRVGGRKPKLSARQADMVRTLHAAKTHTAKEIADTVGVSRSTVYTYLKLSA
jgi:DNA invertase Pin-like site-specific DNA recombinase